MCRCVFWLPQVQWSQCFYCNLDICHSNLRFCRWCRYLARFYPRAAASLAVTPAHRQSVYLPWSSAGCINLNLWIYVPFVCCIFSSFSANISVHFPPVSLITFDSRWGSLDWLFALKTTSSLQYELHLWTAHLSFLHPQGFTALPEKTPHICTHDSGLRNLYGKIRLKTAFEDCFTLLWAKFMWSMLLFAKAFSQMTVNP